MAHTNTAPNSSAPAASMELLQQLIAPDMKRVNEVILDKVRSQTSMITDVATYIISAGGKRIRPSLTLACAQLCGYSGMRHVNLAACVEFIHTATLLHDDVVDESALRRGRPTANEVWSNQSSVLVGDFLFCRSFQLMVEDGSLRVLKILSDAATTISEGEVKQLMVAHCADTNEAAYFEVIESKTAALFAAACEIGGVICDDTEKASALHAYGYNLGIAFQLVDDALDYTASEAELGKCIGDDLREGKITLPMILAYQAATDDEKTFLQNALSLADDDDSASAAEPDLARVLSIISRYDGIAQTLARAEIYAEKARRALDGFAPSPMKSALLDTADFCVQRAY